MGEGEREGGRGWEREREGEGERESRKGREREGGRGWERERERVGKGEREGGRGWERVGEGGRGWERERESRKERMLKPPFTHSLTHTMYVVYVHNMNNNKCARRHQQKLLSSVPECIYNSIATNFEANTHIIYTHTLMILTGPCV